MNLRIARIAHQKAKTVSLKPSINLIFNQSNIYFKGILQIMVPKIIEGEDRTDQSIQSYNHQSQQPKINELRPRNSITREHVR